ncbi:sialic acid TRAP transporter substrate-binding protein SiaP [Pseudovibrio sp. Tun.PSC04-5.I4]|uniref:sialic acid TRAP transporter substrate-binding protein SiaP n=1 Tax=Pseudovibrio sp. Tun.PSC04-5.I4 TaxID=1798213 RepID=UPI00088850C6|nr:sialic acid TRAP transporter substrate-binding protein SiaP [Pseudovibrio sp. Tun.PSC04-5.I4]SDQ71703.1 tripartite ATP-independent transporter solute receptor, DctP family [Pseudovibrio sp. Tun.PSC04-5.I4]
MFVLTKRQVIGALMSATVLMSMPAMANDAIKLRISSPAVESDWHAKMLTVFKEELEKTAPGEFNVEIHLNASLFKQGTEPIAMQRGNLDMAMMSAQDIAKQIPEWSAFTAGYLIRDPDHQQKVFRSDLGKKFYDMVAAKMKIQILDVAYLGTRQLNLRSDMKVSTPEDLNGVKLRMPGSDAWQFLGKALGANPTPMAFGEVYTGLQTGAVDGQDNPLPTVKAAKFYEVTKQIVKTGHLVDGIFLSMAKKKFDSLSAEQQEKVISAVKAASAYNNENRIADEANLEAFFEGKGLTVSTPDVAAFRARVQKMYLESDFAKSWPEGIVEQVNAIK